MRSFRNLGIAAVAANKAYKKCKRSDTGHIYEDATFINWKGNKHEQARCINCGVYFDITLFRKQEQK